MNKVEEYKIPGMTKAVSIYHIKNYGYVAKLNGDKQDLTSPKSSANEIWIEIRDKLSKKRNHYKGEVANELWKGLVLITERIEKGNFPRLNFGGNN